VLSQYSTRRLILEGVLEEVRIYRLNKEREVLRAREEVARMDREGESSRRRRSREDREHENSKERGRPREDRASDNRSAHPREEDPAMMMAGGASGMPPTNPRKKDGYTRLHSQAPGEGNSHGKQRLDRNGKPLVRGKRGWRDAPPDPFPEYKFKMGPMFGLGDHLKERFRWGVDQYHLEQRRKNRRERGSLDGRKKERREMGKGKSRGGGGKPMTKSEGKKPVKEGHGLRSGKGVSSRGQQIPGSPSHTYAQSKQKDHRRSAEESAGRGHDDQTKQDGQTQGGEGRHRKEKEGRSTQDIREDTAKTKRAEADARERGERRARHEAEANSPHSKQQGSRDPSRHVPVYEQTRYSQHVEARERAEAEHASGK